MLRVFVLAKNNARNQTPKGGCSLQQSGAAALFFFSALLLQPHLCIPRLPLRSGGGSDPNHHELHWLSGFVVSC